MIEIKNVCFGYFSDQNILHDINLKIDSGEFICVMGSNGSGKSTLARIMNCLVKKKSGIIVADGLNYDDMKNVYAIRSKIGMVFQNPDNQFVSSVIEEDIAFGPENLNLGREEIKLRVEQSLKIVGMAEYKNFSLNMLSGGQKQKIAVAGVLAMNPDYIIFDESTSMIDDKEELMEKIIELNKIHGKTIIFITHDIEEAMKSDRLIILESGKIIFDDEPENIFYGVKKEISNFDIPFTIKFINEISKYGIDLEKTLSLEKLADDIAKRIG